MNSTLFICLLTLWTLAVAYQVNERESLSPEPPLRPGDLLRSLDELTSDAQVIYSPLQVAPSKSADRRVYDDQGPPGNTDQASEFDYDRAYEDFVSKYFNKGEEDLEPEDEEEEEEGEKSADTDHAVPYETTDDSGDVDQSKPKKTSSKLKKCERIEIDDQNCVICEDPKTNEKSKSCSYSSDSKPKSYGFSSERSRKRSNDDEDDEEESIEEGKSMKREAIPGIQPRRTSIKALLDPKAPDSTLKCTRKKEDGMICFYCGTVTNIIRECMADKSSPKKRRLDEFSKKDSKIKKVYKRMVTYSYKNNGKQPKVKENTYAVYKGY